MMRSKVDPPCRRWWRDVANVASRTPNKRRRRRLLRFRWCRFRSQCCTRGHAPGRALGVDQSAAAPWLSSNHSGPAAFPHSAILTSCRRRWRSKYCLASVPKDGADFVSLLCFALWRAVSICRLIFEPLSTDWLNKMKQPPCHLRRFASHRTSGCSLGFNPEAPDHEIVSGYDLLWFSPPT